ncbi:hypothetical protein JCM19992_21560 [Thermostilla marina]
MAIAVFVEQGEQIDYTPSANVAAGDVVVQGDLVGVARTPIPAGTPGSLAVAGVFDFAKESGGGVTFSAGQKAYWDETNQVAVTTDGGGLNKYLGKAVAAAADADSTVRVRLSQ